MSKKVWKSRLFEGHSPKLYSRVIIIAPYKVIRIPESRKFLLVESGILGSGIQNPAFGIQDPAKKGESRIRLLKIHFKSY